MGLYSFKHKYMGYGHNPSSCMVSVFTDKGTTPQLILFTDLSDGTSVTNASEQIATEVIQKLRNENTRVELGLRFFEYYEGGDHYDEIIYSLGFTTNPAHYSQYVLTSPQWKYCSYADFHTIIKQYYGK